MRALLAVLLLLATGATAAKKAPEFKTGKLIDVTTDTNQAGYRFAVFIVQIDDLIYTAMGDRIGRVTDSLITMAITRSGDSGKEFIVGDPVQVAIDGDNLVLIKPNGKQLKAKITKRTRAVK